MFQQQERTSEGRTNLNSRLAVGARAVSIGLLTSFLGAHAWGQQAGTPPIAGGATQEARERPRVEPDVLAIPSVPERPVQAEEGPRVRVTTFDLQIDPKLSDSTPPDLLTKVHAALDASVASQPEGGLTIGQMEAVARDVTQIFRASGLALAWAYLPAQNVQDGKVQMAVLLGVLGDIQAEGNKGYSLEWLSMPFDGLKNEPVNVSSLESAILRVRDYPGLSPAAVLSPGKTVGTSDLTLRVEERPVEFGLTGDNYGSKVNGEYRARAWASWNNPLGHADRLYVDVLQGFDPTENTYGDVIYTTGLGTSSITGGIQYSLNAYDVDQDLLEQAGGQPVDGEVTIYSIPLHAQLVRSRSLNLGVDFVFSHKDASFNQFCQGCDDTKRDNITMGDLGMTMDVVDHLFGSALGITSFTAMYSYGELNGDDDVPALGQTCTTSRQDGDLKCLGGTFSKGSFQVQRVQQLFKANSLLLRGFYQYTDDALVAIEQVALGGFYSVRAYGTSSELVDKGGFANAEWLLDIHELLPTRPQNWDLTAFLSADYGDGKLNNPLDSDPEVVELKGWGGGMEFQYRFGSRMVFAARFDVATPIDDEESEFSDFDDDDPRYWGWLSISYR
jgi:hemolysin activation/secretion protein